MPRPRVLLLSPSLREGGNAASARRLAAGLRREGLAVRTLATLAPDFPSRLETALRAFRPAVVHALHARKGGGAYLRRAHPGDPPLVVTLTGTEIHRDLADPGRAAEVEEVLRRAALVVSHGRGLAAAAVAAFPALRGRIRVLPKGAVLPPRDPSFDLRRRAGVPRGGILFLLPAGLREVKDPLFALGPLRELRRRGLPVHFVHAGEGLDAGIEEALREAARREPWIRTVGALPRRRMGSAYAAADVVLNTSRAEGLANAILEAGLAGRAVLAAGIPANRELVLPGRTGLLYRPGDPDAFRRAAGRLARDAGLRRRLGAAARVVALSRHGPAAEAAAARAAYAEVLSGPGCPPAPTRGASGPAAAPPGRRRRTWRR